MRILGLMTGTSVDAIDCALVDFSLPEDTDAAGAGSLLRARVELTREVAWPTDLRERIIDAVRAPEDLRPLELLDLDAQIGIALGQTCAEVAASSPGPIDLVVSPGQTVYHAVDRPLDGSWTTRGTLALGNPERIYEVCRIPVLTHVRDADIAAGGTGAPLAPLLDTLLAGPHPGAFLNVGGIANLSLVTPEGVTAGDTGPGNALMDAVAHERTGAACDIDGALAASGTPHRPLLEAMLADPANDQPFPASTGREYFSPAWLRARAAGAGIDLTALATADLVATATEFTALTIANALAREIARAGARSISTLHVTGGGARNPVLMESVARHLRTHPATRDLTLTREAPGGIDPDAKEAVLMTLLGWHTAHGLPGNRRGATGASREVVLGRLHPPRTLAGALSARPTRLIVEDFRVS